MQSILHPQVIDNIPKDLSILWKQFEEYMDKYFTVNNDTLEKELEKNALMIQLMRIKSIEIKDWVKNSLVNKNYKILQRYKKRQDNYDYFFEAWCIMSVNDMFKNPDENAKKHFIPLKKIKYQLYEHIEFFIGIKLFIGHAENTTNSTIKDMKYYYDRIKVHHATYSHHINRKKRTIKNIVYNQSLSQVPIQSFSGAGKNI